MGKVNIKQEIQFKQHSKNSKANFKIHCALLCIVSLLPKEIFGFPLWELQNKPVFSAGLCRGSASITAESQ